MKNIRFLLLLCFVPALLHAQYWVHGFGSQLNDEGSDVAVDASGNTYTTGYFSGTVNFDGQGLASNGLTDMFLVKTNAQGNVQWAVKGGGNGSDRGLSVATDAQGNVYVAGFYTGSANFSGTTVNANAASQDAFVAKYNANGVLQWVRSGGGPQADVAYGVTADASGNVIITGSFKALANFGGITHTSLINPQTQQYSSDVFTVKYSSAGNVLWFKPGKARKEDRGVSVCADAAGSIYVAGLYSDTITFDNVHPNNLQNIAFVVKYDASGNEVWMRRAAASQVNIGGIRADNSGNLLLTGDYQGTLSFYNGNTLVGSATNPQLYKAFIAKFSAAGAVIWAKADGSASEVSSKGIAVDNSGNAYFFGHFRCRFSDYATQYGQGTFNSMGYRDLYVTKYNSQGQWQWSRNFGGQKDEFAGGLAVNAAGEVFAAGSYETRLVFSSETNNPSNYNLSTVNNVANLPGYCSDPNYNSFKYITTQGALDIFLYKNINPNRAPHDYYERSGGGCNRPYVPGCIGVVSSPEDIGCAADSVELCGSVPLIAKTRTSMHGPTNFQGQVSAGPDFKYLWSNGATTKSIIASNPGTYHVTMTTLDDCFQSKDTIHVSLNNAPTPPVVTDSKGININSSNPQPIILCAPDSVTLWGGNFGNLTHNWTGTPGFTNVNSFTIQVFQSGTYIFSVTDTNGCVSSVSVSVIIDGQLPVIDPKIKLYSPQAVNDTVYFCQGTSFSILVYDFITNPNGNLVPPIPYSCPKSYFTVSPSIPFSYSIPGNCNFADFTPAQSGTYNITYYLIRENACDSDTVILNIVINVVLYPLPQVGNITISGPSYICPGDTVALIASGGTGYTWGGPGIVGPNNQSFVLVNQPGQYFVSVSVTNMYGCSAVGGAVHNLLMMPTPYILMNPPNGVICPGGSVTITVYSLGFYQWYGPNGLMVWTGPSITVNQPGFYYCVVTNNGCPMVSNTVEVKQYTTPELVAMPSSVLCPGDSVIINIAGVGVSAIQWLPPLSGNSPSQVIHNTGTYICAITACGITTYDTVLVTLGNPQASIQPTGTFTICDLDTISFSANGGQAAYQWMPNGEQTQVIQVSDPGTYYVIITDTDGCRDTSDSVTVFVKPPVPPPVINDTNVCYGDSVLLNASATGFIEWFSGVWGGQAIDTGNTMQTPPITNQVTYYLQNTDTSNCPSIRVPVTVGIYQSSLLPPIYANDTLFCEGDTIRLWTDTLSNGIYTWWGPNNFSSNQQYPDAFVALPASTGEYFLQVADSFCLSPQNSLPIRVIPTPQAPDLSAACLSVCENNPLELHALSSSSDMFFWQMPHDTSTTASPMVIDARPEHKGMYYVATAVGKCLSAFSEIYIDISDCYLHVPNVFTPNNDGKNDVLKVMHDGLIEVRGLIYNRWGTLLHQWNGTDGYWDGNIDGKPASDGVYYVILEYTFCSGADETKTYKGFVHLMR